MSADDLMRQANSLAEKLRHVRGMRNGRAPDAQEISSMEARLAGLWTAIRAARAGTPAPDAEQRTRPKWDAGSFGPRR